MTTLRPLLLAAAACLPLMPAQAQLEQVPVQDTVHYAPEPERPGCIATGELTMPATWSQLDPLAVVVSRAGPADPRRSAAVAALLAANVAVLDIKAHAPTGCGDAGDARRPPSHDLRAALHAAAAYGFGLAIAVGVGHGMDAVLDPELGFAGGIVVARDGGLPRPALHKGGWEVGQILLAASLPEITAATTQAGR